MEPTEKLLTEWGKWARRVQIIPRYMSPATALLFQNIEQEREPDPQITDDEALRVDAAVGHLLMRNREMGEAVMLYFLRRMSVRQIAAALDRDRISANSLIDAGCAWIDAALCP